MTWSMHSHDSNRVVIDVGPHFGCVYDCDDDDAMVFIDIEDNATLLSVARSTFTADEADKVADAIKEAAKGARARAATVKP